MALATPLLCSATDPSCPAPPPAFSPRPKSGGAPPSPGASSGSSGATVGAPPPHSRSSGAGSPERGPPPGAPFLCAACAVSPDALRRRVEAAAGAPDAAALWRELASLLAHGPCAACAHGGGGRGRGRRGRGTARRVTERQRLCDLEEQLRGLGEAQLLLRRQNVALTSRLAVLQELADLATELLASSPPCEACPAAPAAPPPPPPPPSAAAAGRAAATLGRAGGAAAAASSSGSVSAAGGCPPRGRAGGAAGAAQGAAAGAEAAGPAACTGACPDVGKAWGGQAGSDAAAAAAEAGAGATCATAAVARKLLSQVAADSELRRRVLGTGPDGYLQAADRSTMELALYHGRCHDDPDSMERLVAAVERRRLEECAAAVLAPCAVILALQRRIDSGEERAPPPHHWARVSARAGPSAGSCEQRQLVYAALEFQRTMQALDDEMAAALLRHRGAECALGATWRLEADLSRVLARYRAAFALHQLYVLSQGRSPAVWAGSLVASYPYLPWAHADAAVELLRHQLLRFCAGA